MSFPPILPKNILHLAERKCLIHYKSNTLEVLLKSNCRELSTKMVVTIINDHGVYKQSFITTYINFNALIIMNISIDSAIMEQTSTIFGGKNYFTMSISISLIKIPLMLLTGAARRGGFVVVV